MTLFKRLTLAFSMYKNDTPAWLLHYVIVLDYYNHEGDQPFSYSE